MKLIHIIPVILTVTAIAILIAIKTIAVQGFYSLYQSPRFTPEGIESVRKFDPDKDAIFLPSFEGKDFFCAVDDLSIVRRPDVRLYLYQYLTNGRVYVTESIAMARTLIPLMEPILKNYPDIPEDILLLQLLESGYNTHALSSSAASGIWQFVSNTSVPLGLKNDPYVDERRDIQKSTDAALRHLRSLYQQFGSWEMALAAYNAGAGSVRRTLGTLSRENFWHTVDRQGFRPETNEYVSRYAALMLIYKNTRRFGIEDEIRKAPHPDMKSVVCDSPVKIDLLAAQAGIPQSELMKYNPELKGNITPPSTAGYPLKVSAELRDIVELYARDPRCRL
jgi:membrane-bound lytic murein transglycosylase D